MYEQYRQSAEMWERLLEYGIKRGEFLPVDTEAVIDLILFSYQGVRMYSKLMPVDPPDTEKNPQPDPADTYRKGVNPL